MYLLRMGQVNFLPSGQVFGVMILLGSDYGSVDFSSGQQILTSGPIFFEKSYQFELNRGIIAFKTSDYLVGSSKNFLGLARVQQIIARVGSGWPKHPRVGPNFGSGFDPTHP